MNCGRFSLRVLMPLLLAGTAPASAQAQRQQTIDAILKAWQQRQDRFRTVRVEFEGEEIVTKGAYSRGQPPKDLKQDDAGALPPEDHKAPVTEVLVIGVG